MTATFGDFLDAAGARIGGACRGSELPSGTVHAVVGELHRLVATLTRYLTDVASGSGSDLAAADGTGGCAAAAGRARLVLQQAGAALWPAADTAPSPSPGGAGGVAADLSAAAMSLAAGRDLLQTHFRPGPEGGGLAASHWAAVITAEPVTAALLSELSGYSHRLARWAGQLWVSGPPDSPESHAFNIASRGLWDAAAALRDAQQGQPPPPAGRILLRAIPANAPPPRQPPTGGEPIHQLCTGAMTTAERLRYLARPQPGAAWPEAVTAASWQRTAQAVAIVGHASELILRSLARQASMDQAATALRGAADWLAKTWLTGRTAIRLWDPITTGTRGPLTAAAAETADLVLWTGRLAYRNPAWTPARRHLSALRGPSELAAGPDSTQQVLAAVHHATDAATRLLAADRKAIGAAAAGRRLFTPTRLLPDGYDVPYRYAPIPRETIDALLGSYNTAIRQASRAVAALDKASVETDAPSAILAMARAAGRGEQVTSPAPPQLPARPTPAVRQPDIVQRRLLELGVSEPTLLLRAASIDQAANDLIAEATAKSQRRDTAEGRAAETSETRQAARYAADLAAQDSPVSAHRPGPQIQGWAASAKDPIALAARDFPKRTAPPEERRASGGTALPTAQKSLPPTPHAEDRLGAARSSRRRR